MAKKADAPAVAVSVSVAVASPEADVETFLARAGAKERAKIEKHLTLRDSEGSTNFSRLWRRVAGVMGGLAPMPAQTMGNLAVLFFIPDGKYRMQVFALEDAGDGQISIYVPDVMAAAQKKKILLKEKQPGEFSIGGSAANVVKIELLDASNTPSPHPHVKNLIGWNRKAIRVILPVSDPDGPQVGAAEALIELAAKTWAAKAAKA